MATRDELITAIQIGIRGRTRQSAAASSMSSQRLAAFTASMRCASFGLGNRSIVRDRDLIAGFMTTQQEKH